MCGWINTPKLFEDMVKMYRNIASFRIDKRSVEVSKISSAVFYQEKKYFYVEKECSPKVYWAWSKVPTGGASRQGSDNIRKNRGLRAWPQEHL